MKNDGTRRQGMDSRASLQSRRPIVTQGWFQARYIDRWHVQPARPEILPVPPWCIPYEAQGSALLPGLD